jgi:hypothetical protein
VYQKCLKSIFGTDLATSGGGSQECFQDSDCTSLGARCNLLRRQCQVTLASQEDEFIACFIESLDIVEQEAVFNVSF